MHTATDTIADFNGVLVQRHYTAGQRYMQLVFHTAEGVTLSISRNIQAMKSLTIGQTYHVKGKLYTRGDKTFVQDPTATPVVAKSGLAHRHRLFLSVLVLGIGLAGVGSVYALSSPSSSANKQASAARTAAPKSPANVRTASATTPEKAAATAEQPAQTPPPPTTYVQPKRTSVPAIPKPQAAAPTVVAPPVEQPAVVPVPDPVPLQPVTPAPVAEAPAVTTPVVEEKPVSPNPNTGQQPDNTDSPPPSAN